MTTTAHARRNDPDTSWIAARRVKVEPCRDAIMREAGHRRRSWTAEDMCCALPMYTDSNVRGRIAELCREGLIQIVGYTPNCRGNPVALYLIIPVQQRFFGG